MQSAHFYSHGDTPLDVHGKVYNGKSHMPLPTKQLWFSASNSLLGNAKGHYDVVMNLLRHPAYRAKSQSKRMIDAVIVNEWWWTGSCEYADVVLGVDSWGEYNVHDMTNSCTNPFMQVMPLSKIDRVHNTRSDSQIYAGVAAKLAEITGDERFNDYWNFIEKDKAATYIQRVLDHSNITKGYHFEDLLEEGREGRPRHDDGAELSEVHRLRAERRVPSLVQPHGASRVPPRRARVPNARREHPASPGADRLDLPRAQRDRRGTASADPAGYTEEDGVLAGGSPRRDAPGAQRRDDSRRAAEDAASADESQGFTHQWITPKYRHSVHTLVADLDILAVWWGPYGDMYRHDKRSPWVGEGYVDINPTTPRSWESETATTSGWTPTPRTAPSTAGRSARGGQGGAGDDARALLPGNAARHRADLLPLPRGFVRQRAGHETRSGRAGQEPDDGLPGDVPLREPSERHAILAAPDAPHRLAGAQEPDGSGDREGLLSRTFTARTVRRARPS